MLLELDKCDGVIVLCYPLASCIPVHYTSTYYTVPRALALLDASFFLQAEPLERYAHMYASMDLSDMCALAARRIPKQITHYI